MSFDEELAPMEVRYAAAKWMQEQYRISRNKWRTTAIIAISSVVVNLIGNLVRIFVL